MPGAIEIVLSWMPRVTAATPPAGAAGSSAGVAARAMASASAFVGAMPAKLGVGYVPPLVFAALEPIELGGAVVTPALAALAAVRAAARAWCAEIASHSPMMRTIG